MTSHREQMPKVGSNRTGIGAAPERAREMLQGSDEFAPSSHGSADAAGEVRAEYAAAGERTGSIPAVGAEGTPMSPDLAPLIDKLGARLAFERVGTRLYDALLSKHDAYGSFDGGPSRGDLEQLRREEHEHMLLLHGALTGLGADATAVTASANLQLTIGRGIPDVATDARTTLLESLEAALVAELADGASWESLIAIAEAHGFDELAQQGRQALATEDEHLEKVRSWIAAGHGLTE